MDSSADGVHSLDYFSGGVPAGMILCGQLQDLRKLAAPIKDIERELNPLLELCFIGAVAYFESFFKDHFAATINICPPLIQTLRERQIDVSIDAADVLSLEPNAFSKVGFLLAEKFDFGTPKKINSLYSAAFAVSPFSITDRRMYEQVLAERNLLVHHGGVYTLRFCRQKFASMDFANQVFHHSLVVTRTRLIEVLVCMINIAEKTCNASATKLRKFVNQNRLVLSSEQIKAVDFLAVPPNYKIMFQIDDWREL